MEHLRAKIEAVLLGAAILLTTVPCAAQSTPNPEFREKTLIPFFHEIDPAIVHFQTFLKREVDGEYTLLLVRGGNPTPGPVWPMDLPLERLRWGAGDVLGLFLRKTDDPESVWELEILRNEGHVEFEPYRVKIDQVDNTSILLRVRGDWKTNFTYKLRIDVASKRVLRSHSRSLPVKLIFPWNHELYFVIGGPREYWVDGQKKRRQEQETVAVLKDGRPTGVDRAEQAAVLANARDETSRHRISPPFGPQGKFDFRTVLQADPRGGASYVQAVAERVGNNTRLFELPKSTFEQFARLRPDKVRDGYGPNSMFEEEGIGEIGAYQIFENRFWFGKSFYEGEGSTGIGGFGYFDPDERRFVVFSPPEIVRSSVSALLVEDEEIWLALGDYGFSNYSDGLLRYERNSKDLEHFIVGKNRCHGNRYCSVEFITQIKRWKDSLYLASTNGLFVLQENYLTRYDFEPNLDGGTAIVPFKRHALVSP